MPKKDGLYVLSELNKRGIDKNIIVATSYNEPKVIRKVSEYGVSYYILKPFELTDLESRILELSQSMESKSMNL
jgi:response regulator of citrate/malate metabolism